MKERIELNSLALMVRKQFDEDAYSPIDIFAMVSGMKNLTIVFYPMSIRISGMCIKDRGNIIIGINSDSSYGRRRYTLAHELYHILFENGLNRSICEMSFTGEKNNSEKEADIFASYLLMPYDGLRNYINNKGLDTSWKLSDVVAVEQFFQISHNAMLLRLLYEKYISKEEYIQFQNVGITKIAISMGYSGDLYTKAADGKKYYTIGEYIRKVEKVAEKELISEGKREELLLDAFRADIVYGLTEEGIDLK